MLWTSRLLCGAAPAFVAVVLVATSAAAQDAQSDSLIKSVMKIVGFATDVKPPPDFVQQSRPAQAPATIPVFVKSPEPPGTAKSAQELGAIDTDLEAISKQHDVLRASFPPSAKAVADVAAAKAAKAKSKAAGKAAQKSPLPSF